MVDKINKFLCKLTAKELSQVQKVVAAIAADKLKNLDIKPVSGHKGWYRCRTGKIRIVFVKTSAGKNIIYTVDFRGQVYKKI